MSHQFPQFEVLSELRAEFSYQTCYFGPTGPDVGDEFVLLHARLKNPQGAERTVARITTIGGPDTTGCHVQTSDATLIKPGDPLGFYTLIVESSVIHLRNPTFRLSGHPTVLLLADGIAVSGDQPHARQKNSEEPYVAAWRFLYKATGVASANRAERERIAGDDVPPVPPPPTLPVPAPIVIGSPPTGSQSDPGALCSGTAGIIEAVSGHDAAGAETVYAKIYAENATLDDEPPGGTPNVVPDLDGTWTISDVPANTCSTTNTKQKIRAWAKYFLMGTYRYDSTDKDVWIQRS